MCFSAAEIRWCWTQAVRGLDLAIALLDIPEVAPPHLVEIDALLAEEFGAQIHATVMRMSAPRRGTCGLRLGSIRGLPPLYRIGVYSFHAKWLSEANRSCALHLTKQTST